MSRTRSKILKRRKGATQRLIPFLKRIGIVLAVFVIFIWAGAWAWMSGVAPSTLTAVKEKVVAQSADWGFVVENVYIEGRRFTDRDMLVKLVGVKRGDELFAVSPGDTKDRISTLDWIKSVSVTRRLPDSVYIHIEERIPMALVRNKDKSLSLLDWEGVVISENPDERFKNMLIATGEGAAEALPEFLPLLIAEKNLFNKIESVQYIGMRRWDLFTHQNVRIQLPEDETAFALARLSRYETEEMILAKPVKDIDLRQTDRLVIEPLDGATPQIVKAAGESL